MLHPEILLTLKLNQQLFTDPRRIALLKGVEQTGSLNKAAKTIGISYKTAWDALNEINRLSPRPFVITTTGGKGGGGTKLSAYGVRFIQLYDLLTKIQYNAYNVLQDEQVPLDDILAATARLSLQTSARNQLHGIVKKIQLNHISGFITVLLSDGITELTAYITQRSAERLQLSENKAVILLIKAPLVEPLINPLENKGTSQADNCLPITIQKIVQDDEWSEIEFSLTSGLVIYGTKKSAQIRQLNLQVNTPAFLHIHPENIIVATLV